MHESKILICGRSSGAVVHASSGGMVGVIHRIPSALAHENQDLIVLVRSVFDRSLSY